MDSVVVEEPVETAEQAEQFTDIEKEAPQAEEQPQERPKTAPEIAEQQLRALLGG